MENMRFTIPWNIGVTGESTVELSMANDAEARKLAKSFERHGIVCTINGHWIQVEAGWETVFDMLRGAEGEEGGGTGIEDRK